MCFIYFYIYIFQNIYKMSFTERFSCGSVVGAIRRYKINMRSLPSRSLPLEIEGKQECWQAKMVNWGSALLSDLCEAWGCQGIPEWGLKGKVVWLGEIGQQKSGVGGEKVVWKSLRRAAFASQRAQPWSWEACCGFPAGAAPMNLTLESPRDACSSCGSGQSWDEVAAALAVLFVWHLLKPLRCPEPQFPYLQSTLSDRLANVAEL